MSGMGENTPDPSRAETRKRKECPDQLGPRWDPHRGPGEPRTPEPWIWSFIISVSHLIHRLSLVFLLNCQAFGYVLFNLYRYANRLQILFLQEEACSILPLGSLCTLILKTSLFYIILTVSHFYSFLLLECHKDKRSRSKKVWCLKVPAFFSSFSLSFLLRARSEMLNPFAFELITKTEDLQWIKQIIF